MDGIARVSVESHVMEYIMHCMYNTFLKIQKGLHVAISWQRDDDTVMITSTQRSATRDLHHALNRFFILYNTVRRNLTFAYCAISGSTHNQLYVTNQLAEKYRRIYVEKARSKYEVKLWGFKAEIGRAIDFVQKISAADSRRLGSPPPRYIPGSTTRYHHNFENFGSLLPQLNSPKESRNRIRSWVHEPTIFESQLKESLLDVLPPDDSSDVVYSKSFEKKLSQMRYAQGTHRSNKAPSRYSTSEIKRQYEVKRQPKKVSTFPKLIPASKTKTYRLEVEHNQIRTPTGLSVSCTLRDEAPPDSRQVLITEISSTGKLADDYSWMIAKDRAHEITRIIKLHISLYGELAPSKAIVTPGFQLNFNQIVHVTPPSWDEENVKKSLKQLLAAYRNIFRIADSDIRTDRISIPVLGRCPSAAKVFPELVALSLVNQAILSSTKAGFRSLRHIRILCSRQSELDYVKDKVFSHVMSLRYDPRYLQQQRTNFLVKDGILANTSFSED